MSYIYDFKNRGYKVIEINGDTSLIECMNTGDRVRVKTQGIEDIGFHVGVRDQDTFNQIYNNENLSDGEISNLEGVDLFFYVPSMVRVSGGVQYDDANVTYIDFRK